MDEFTRLAAENERMKSLMRAQGFKFTHDPKTGAVLDIRPPAKPRRPTVKHTAVTWAKKRGFKNSLGMVRTLTGNKAIGFRKFKNMVERAELIKDAQAYLITSGYKLPAKFFNKVPNYVLKNNGFYENVRALFDSLTEQSEAKELTNDDIKYAMETSIDRIRRVNELRQTSDKKIRSGVRASRAGISSLQETGIKTTPTKRGKTIKNILKAARK